MEEDEHSDKHIHSEDCSHEASLSEFEEAGKIASRVREDSKKLIMIGEPLLDIAETVEQMINDEGAEMAFPVNISINEIAAHYTPEFDCTRTLEENSIVKIDLGTYLNGAIADTAYTIDLSDDGRHDSLVKASEEALAAALGAIKPGANVGDIGGIIEEKIRARGFKPISNLTGHMIKTNELHAGVEIPNIKTNDNYEFQVGDIFAVEPFATTGSGFVTDLEQVEIFGLYIPHQVRMRQSRKILQYILENFGVMPFAERWVRKNPEFKSKLLVSAALKEMLEAQIIRGYPVLRDGGNGLVSQAEHTVIVTENGNKITTK
ncbi:MAG: type II methionyl aminopeptidase [Candidatus Micrarchaeota archaeon]